MLADAARWPLTAHRDAYAIGAGGPIAALAAAWFAIATVVSPGTASPLSYVPLFNPLELTLALTLVALFLWSGRFSGLPDTTRFAWLGVGLFGCSTAPHCAPRTTGEGFRGSSPLCWRSKLLQAGLTLAWTATAVVLMFFATRRALRPLWMTGAGLLALAVGKLFLIDLGTLSGLPRVIAFLGVGTLLLLIGYLSPLPPAPTRRRAARRAADPVESLNLFYRDRRAGQLATIRGELSASFRHRSGAAAVRIMRAISTASQRSASGHEAATSAGSATPAGARST